MAEAAPPSIQASIEDLHRTIRFMRDLRQQQARSLSDDEQEAPTRSRSTSRSRAHHSSDACPAVPRVSWWDTDQSDCSCCAAHQSERRCRAKSVSPPRRRVNHSEPRYSAATVSAAHRERERPDHKERLEPPPRPSAIPEYADLVKRVRQLQTENLDLKKQCDTLRSKNEAIVKEKAHLQRTTRELVDGKTKAAEERYRILEQTTERQLRQLKRDHEWEQTKLREQLEVQLQEEHQKWQDHNSGLEHELRLRREEVSTLQHQVEILHSQRHQTDADVQTLRDTLHTLESELGAANATLAKREAEIEQVKLEALQHSNEAEEWREKAEAVQRTNGSLASAIRSLEEQLSAARDTCSKVEVEAEKRTREAEAIKHAFQKREDGMQKEISEWKDKAEGVQRMNAQLSAAVRTAEARCSDLQESQLRQQVEWERQLRDAENARHAMKKRQEELVEEIADLKAKSAARSAKFREARDKQRAMSEELNAARDELLRRQGEADVHVRAAQEAFDHKWKEMVDLHKREITQARADYDLLATDHARVQQELAHWRATAEDTDRQRAQMLQEVTRRVQAEVTKLRASEGMKHQALVQQLESERAARVAAETALQGLKQQLSQPETLQQVPSTASQRDAEAAKDSGLAPVRAPSPIAAVPAPTTTEKTPRALFSDVSSELPAYASMIRSSDRSEYGRWAASRRTGRGTLAVASPAGAPQEEPYGELFDVESAEGAGSGEWVTDVDESNAYLEAATGISRAMQGTATHESPEVPSSLLDLSQFRGQGMEQVRKTLMQQTLHATRHALQEWDQLVPVYRDKYAEVQREVNEHDQRLLELKAVLRSEAYGADATGSSAPAARRSSTSTSATTSSAEPSRQRLRKKAAARKPSADAPSSPQRAAVP
eukprot:TRINITY_DN18941_c0_g1_i1.p1 TRINITY_DN18941_c0_g1~~TRINITY_DN18941_c0_g1_i1.p1  ORF type:complete len:900 (+),score=176.16 TRINITY_DN18941_c0_g1_i1:28-2700(+)